MFTAVAPLAGAWIEIMSKVSISCVSAVAPLAGAWIEIAIADPLTNMRSVAPLAGAWIEIDKFGIGKLHLESLPSRERGLKCIISMSIDFENMSLPSRERGLKFICDSV